MEVNRISLPLSVPLLPNQINLTLVFLSLPNEQSIDRQLASIATTTLTAISVPNH
jgi:hypothetical protein